MRGSSTVSIFIKITPPLCSVQHPLYQQCAENTVAVM